MADYRSRVYEHYITNHFGKDHNPDEFKKDAKIHGRYFKKNYLPRMPKNKDARILDAGCGMGHFMGFLQKEGYTNHVGVDTSKEIVEFCHKHGFDTVQQGDLFAYLDDKKDEFDLIIFNDVIEHLTKEEVVKMLDLFHGALKKGGMVIIKTPNCSNPFTTAGRYIDFTHELGFTEVSMKSIMSVCGFTDTTVHGTDIYVLYENPLNYIAKFVAAITSKILYLMSFMYGRNSIKIWEKDFIAVGRK